MDFAALLAETRSRNAGNEMLRATDEEIEEVKSYFNWQAPDLTITFLQKVYSEKLLAMRTTSGTFIPTVIAGG